MGLKRSIAGAAVLALFACTKDKPPPPPPPSVPVETPKPPDPGAVAAKPEVTPEDTDDESPVAWVIHSGDGNATLRQKPGAPGKCFLECMVGAEKAWSAASVACFGVKSDRKFLANDCVRTVVMMPAPPRGEPWRKAQVMRVYKKEKLDYPVVGVAALKDERLIKSSPSWLKGCYGLPGDPPRYSADGLAVEYDTIDGKSGSVPLAPKQ